MKINNDSNTEKSILEAAERLFLQKGFSLTSTTAIGKEAGCNQALVHYYFRTKERLFEAVFENKFRLFVSGLVQKVDSGLSFEEKLRTAIEAHYDMLAANPGIPFLIFNELTTNPRRLENFKSRIRELPVTVLKQFQKELEEEIKKGKVRPVAPVDLLLTIISMNVSLFLVGPVIKTALDLSERDYKKLLVSRRSENVAVILRSLRP